MNSIKKILKLPVNFWNKGAKQKIVILLGAAVIFVSFAAVAPAPQNTSETEAETKEVKTEVTATPSPTPKAMEIEAQALIDSFDKNKLAADDKFAGKLIQTTAYIDNISKDILGNYYLSLNPSNEEYYYGTYIQCFFKDKSELTSLENGSKVTVKGTMDEMSIGIVIIKDCSVIN